MLRIAYLLPLGLSLSLVGAAVTADAQQRHDSSAPIDFSAQHMELQDKANRAILTGNVSIRQAEMTLRAERLTVNYTGDIIEGAPQVSRLDAAGGVSVTRPDESATSQYAVYDLNRRTITMIGGVTLRQKGNVLNGGRMTIDLDTGRATLDGSGVQSGTDATGVKTEAGRVSGRFSVPQRSQPAPAPSPTPQ